MEFPHSHALIPAALLAAALAASSSLSAQTRAGLIGARFIEATVFYEDIDASGIDNGLGLGLRANVPLHAAIDLSLSAAQEEIDTNNFKETNAFATIVAHWNARDFTPYVVAGVGNIWQSVTIEGGKISEDEVLYLAGVGVEAPIGDRTALDLRAAYHAYASSDLGHYWIYGLSLDHWFSDRIAGTAAVNFRESDSTLFSAGVVFRF